MGADGAGPGGVAGAGAQAVTLRNAIFDLLEKTGPLTAVEICALLAALPRPSVLATVGKMYRNDMLHVADWRNIRAGAVMRQQMVFNVGPQVGEAPAKPAPVPHSRVCRAARARRLPRAPFINSVFSLAQ